MKSAIAFAAILAVAAAQFGQPSRPNPPPRPSSPVAARASNDQAATVLRYDNDVGPDGSYAYAVEIDNGIQAQAQGTPKDFGGNPPIIPVVAQGSFSWTSPEGKVVSISYIADENGYQPAGDDLPTPPPVPEAILRSLEYIAKVFPQKK